MIKYKCILFQQKYVFEKQFIKILYLKKKTIAKLLAKTYLIYYYITQY